MIVIGKWVTAVFALLFIAGCCAPSNNDEVQFTILQLNDVYEMTPLGQVDGKGGQGGLARVATIKKELKEKNSNTWAVLAGDMVSPSAIGLAKIDGKRAAGAQMVAGVNPFLDLMAIGNHEFDIKQNELIERIAESKFQWITSNLTQTGGAPISGVEDHHIFEAKTGSHSLKVGVFSVCIDIDEDWIEFEPDHVKVAKQQIKALKDKGAEYIIALTHLSITEDTNLAQMVPDIDVIMGGHEHENIDVRRGSDFTPILKADANARTVYIHRITWNPETKESTIKSELRLVDDSIADDPETKAIVDEWQSKAFASFREEGIEPTNPVAKPNEDLDGKEASVRNGSTRLTQIIAEGMKDIAQAQVSIYNGGSIRIDDELPANQMLTEYDVLRILPFGGQVVLVNIKGSLLKKILDQGVQNKGSGGFLQYAGISGGTGAWALNDTPIQDNTEYQVAFTDFLLTGRETGLDYLTRDNPDLTVVGEKGDVRLALSTRLKQEYPNQ